MYNQLTSEQRYFIEVSLQNGMSKKMIAESLKAHPSTIYREISRNKGDHRYHHKLAQQKCDERKNRMRAPDVKGKVQNMPKFSMSKH